jgi:hypothetical protein
MATHKGKQLNVRTRLSVPITYAYCDTKDDKPDDYLEGTTFDISNTGLSFYTNSPLHVGACIKIISKDIWKEQRSGTVIWCKTLSYKHYLVGVSLQF